MSRLTDKIKKAQLNVAIAQEQLDLMQDRLDYLNMKQRQYSQRRTRKAERKRLANDPQYRMTQSMLKRISREMFMGKLVVSSEDLKMIGMREQLKWPRY